MRSRMIPNAEHVVSTPLEILEDQIKILEGVVGKPVELAVSADAAEDDEELEEVSIWLDQWVGEGIRHKEPESVLVQDWDDLLVIRVGKTLGQHLADTKSFGSIYRYRGYDNPPYDISGWSELVIADRFTDVEDNALWGELFIVPSHLSYGDYDSSTAVERSNNEVFYRMFGEVDGVFEISGNFALSAIAIRLDTLDEDDLFRVLDDLEDYPIIDEDHWSSTEQRMLDEQWEEWGLQEFVRELEQAFEIEIPDQDLRGLSNLFWETLSRAGHGPHIEGGGGAVFNYEDVIENLDLDDLVGVVAFEMQEDDDE